MPRVVYTPEFLTDLDRIKKFLNHLERSIYKRFTTHFRKKLEIIRHSPKAFLAFGDNRIYFLSFGARGYAIQYHYDESCNEIKLLRIRHQKEAGF